MQQPSLKQEEITGSQILKLNQLLSMKTGKKKRLKATSWDWVQCVKRHHVHSDTWFTLWKGVPSVGYCTSPFCVTTILISPWGHRAKNQEITGHTFQSYIKRLQFKGGKKSQHKCGRTRKPTFLLKSIATASAAGPGGRCGMSCFQQLLVNQGKGKEMPRVVKGLSCS